VRARVPRELGDQAVFVEQLLRRGLSRGRVDVTVHCEGVAAGGVSLDHDRAREALAALRAVAREEGLGDDVPLSLLSTVPDLFAPVTHVDPGAARAALAEAVARCLDALGRMREAEGAELAALWDRFLVRCYVRPVAGEDAFIGVITSARDTALTSTKLTIAEWAQARTEVDALLFPLDSWAYFTSDDDVLAFLTAAERCLTPKGVLFVEANHPKEAGQTYTPWKESGSGASTRQGRYLAHHPKYQAEAKDFMDNYLKTIKANVIVDFRK
jgi:hypothetical protein